MPTACPFVATRVHRGNDRASVHGVQLRRARIVDEWVALICRRTGNLRTCRLLLGHTNLECTVRYLGIEADDALVMPKQTDL